jgi:hypothetical protein
LSDQRALSVARKWKGLSHIWMEKNSMKTNLFKITRYSKSNRPPIGLICQVWPVTNLTIEILAHDLRKLFNNLRFGKVLKHSHNLTYLKSKNEVYPVSPEFLVSVKVRNLT